MPSAMGPWEAALSRVLRALIGRACRYGLGRRVLGAPSGEDPAIALLGQDSLAAWEDYLRVPRGTLRLPGEGTYCAVALWRGSVIGHVSVFRQWERPDVCVPGWWLTGLEVAPRWRGRAVGRRLVQEVLKAWSAREQEQELFLVVHRSNTPAIALFEGHGFRLLYRPDWESRLRRAYPRMWRGEWAYQIMARTPGGH